MAKRLRILILHLIQTNNVASYNFIKKKKKEKKKAIFSNQMQNIRIYLFNNSFFGICYTRDQYVIPILERDVEDHAFNNKKLFHLFNR